MVSWEDGRDLRPAQWALGIELKPGVDAVDVEVMRAAREDLDPLLLSELAQAHGTVLLAGIHKHDDGDGANDRRLKAADFRRDAVAAATVGRQVKAALGDEDVVGQEENGADQEDAQGSDG